MENVHFYFPLFDHFYIDIYIWGKEEDTGIAVRKAEKAMQTAKNKFYAANAELKNSRPGYLDALLQEFRDSTFIPYLQPLYSIQYNRVA